MIRSTLRLLSIIVLVSIIAIWFLLGANRGWTKTSVSVQKIDEVTGIEYAIFENRFVPGVDFLVLGIGGFAIMLALLSLTGKKKSHSP